MADNGTEECLFQKNIPFTRRRTKFRPNKIINNPLDPGLLFTGHNETAIINSKLGVWKISTSLKFSRFLQN